MILQANHSFGAVFLYDFSFFIIVIHRQNASLEDSIDSHFRSNSVIILVEREALYGKENGTYT